MTHITYLWILFCFCNYGRNMYVVYGRGFQLDARATFESDWLDWEGTSGEKGNVSISRFFGQLRCSFLLFGPEMCVWSGYVVAYLIAVCDLWQDVVVFYQVDCNMNLFLLFENSGLRQQRIWLITNTSCSLCTSGWEFIT